MLSDVGVQDVRECGSNIERNRVGEQNQKRTVRHIGDHQPEGHDSECVGSCACRVGRSRNRLSLPSLEKLHQNRFWRRTGQDIREALTAPFVNHDDYCRYPTTRRVASSTSFPTASSDSISERCKTAVWVSASIDVTHTNAASPRSTMRISSRWSSR